MHAVPTVVVEVISPTDMVAPMDEKVAQYFDAGVAEVWVVHPDVESVEIRRPNGTATWLGVDDTLSGGGLIPGFAVKVRDIFAVR